MSKILVSMYNFARDPSNYNTLPPFYETFINALVDSGNDVFCYFHKNYAQTFEGEIPEGLLNKIKEFSPDFAIFFNHEFYDITHYFDIPILVYEVDSPLYIKNKAVIKRNISRYKFVTIQSGDVQLLKDLFSLNANTVMYIPPFTGLRHNENEHQCYNISFVGANWLWGGADFAVNFGKALSSSQDRQKALLQLQAFKRNPFDFPEVTYDSTDKSLFTNFKENSNRLSGILRARYLSAVADLGLELRGLYWDHPSMAYFPELTLCFNRTPIFSLQDSELFYNKSKLSINTNHIQAVSGFSWRVCDIMASNSCLVSEFKPDMARLFKGLNIPMFSTPQEARELCIKYLQEENRRQDIVAACHEVIEKNHRVDKAIILLNEFLGIKPNKSIQGSLIIYSDRDSIGSTSSSSKLGSLTEFEKKYRKLSHFLERKTIQATSLLIFNRVKRLNYRANHLDNLEKRFHEEERLNWYKQQQGKNLTVVRRLKQVATNWKLRVAFIVIFDSVFPAESVFKKMLVSDIFEPMIVVIPDISRGKFNMLSQLEKTTRVMKERYGDKVISSYHKETKSFLDFSNCIDIVCSANPYDSMTHANYRVRTLCDKGIISFYINYGFPGVKFGRKVFCSQFCSLQWKYFIESELLRPEYEEFEIIRGANVVVTGYPKMDQLSLFTKQGNSSRKKIIIAPHHTVKAIGNLQLSNFLKYANFFLELPKIFPEVDFIFRPHPLLFVTLAKDEFWGAQRVEEYLNTLKMIPNIQYQDGGDYFQTFAEADGIIHDCSSFLAEWLFTEKPGCYLLHDKGQISEQFMPFGEDLLSYYRQAFSKEDILKYVEDVIHGTDDNKKERVDFVRKFLKVNYPHATDSIIENLEKAFL